MYNQASPQSPQTSVAKCLTAPGEGVEPVVELESFTRAGQERLRADLGRGGGGGLAVTGLLTFLPAIKEVCGTSTATVGFLDAAALALAVAPLGLECEAAERPRQHGGQLADVPGTVGRVNTGPGGRGGRGLLLSHTDTDTLSKAEEQVLSSATTCDTTSLSVRPRVRLKLTAVHKFLASTNRSIEGESCKHPFALSSSLHRWQQAQRVHGGKFGGQL